MSGRFSLNNHHDVLESTLIEGAEKQTYTNNGFKQFLSCLYRYVTKLENIVHYHSKLL